MKKWLLLLLAAVPLTIYLVACNCGDKDDLLKLKSPGESDDSNKPLTAGMSGSALGSAATAPDNEEYTGEWVYLTASGSKYHCPDCQHVEGKSNLRRMTRVEATAQGFEPCKTCDPGK